MKMNKKLIICLFIVTVVLSTLKSNYIFALTKGYYYGDSNISVEDYIKEYRRYKNSSGPLFGVTVEEDYAQIIKDISKDILGNKNTVVKSWDSKKQQELYNYFFNNSEVNLEFCDPKALDLFENYLKNGNVTQKIGSNDEGSKGLPSNTIDINENISFEDIKRLNEDNFKSFDIKTLKSFYKKVQAYSIATNSDNSSIQNLILNAIKNKDSNFDVVDYLRSDECSDIPSMVRQDRIRYNTFDWDNAEQVRYLTNEEISQITDLNKLKRAYYTINEYCASGGNQTSTNILEILNKIRELDPTFDANKFITDTRRQIEEEQRRDEIEEQLDEQLQDGTFDFNNLADIRNLTAYQIYRIDDIDKLREAFKVLYSYYNGRGKNEVHCDAYDALVKQLMDKDKNYKQFMEDLKNQIIEDTDIELEYVNPTDFNKPNITFADLVQNAFLFCAERRSTYY